MVQHADIDHTGLTGVGGSPDLAGKELDYAQITSPPAITNVGGTTTSDTDLVVSGNAVSYDGSTTVEITFFTPDLQAGTTYIRLFLFDGTSIAGKLALQLATGRGPVTASKRLTPSNASHTYSIRADVDAGEGNVQAGAGTTTTYVPAYIRITRVSS